MSRAYSLCSFFHWTPLNLSERWLCVGGVRVAHKAHARASARTRVDRVSGAEAAKNARDVAKAERSILYIKLYSINGINTCKYCYGLRNYYLSKTNYATSMR